MNYYIKIKILFFKYILLYIFKISDKNYLNAFGKVRFQNELHELRRKLDSEWYEKLNEIEEAVLNSEKLQTILLKSETIKVCIKLINNISKKTF